jgi:hypothetical protein
MPGKALAVMLILHLIGVLLLSLVLTGMEGRMLDRWAHNRSPDSVPHTTRIDSGAP